MKGMTISILRFQCSMATLMMAALVVSSPAHATITVAGDLSPPASNPSWSSGLGEHIGVYIGVSGRGLVLIDGGSVLTTTDSFMANGTASMGSVIITGTDSKWNVRRHDFGYGQVAFGILLVGRYGLGTIEVADGGALRVDQSLAIAPGEGGIGTLILRDSGSSAAARSVYVGGNGRGTLTLREGTQLNAGNMTVHTGTSGQGVLNLYVSGDDMLSVAYSNLENNGTINLFAGEGLAPGVYQPISPGGSYDITGPGQVKAMGGTWDSLTRTFTAGAIEDGTGGLVSTDLSGARYSFAGGSLIAAFNQSAGLADFTATELALATLSGAPVLVAFDFDTTLSADSTLLSFDIGSGYALDELLFWHRAAPTGPWNMFTPDNAVISGNRVSFSVDGFSSYAVTTAVPEPSQFMFMGVGLLVVLLRGTRLRKYHRQSGDAWRWHGMRQTRHE